MLCGILALFDFFPTLFHLVFSLSLCAFVHHFSETSPVCATSMAFQQMFGALYRLTNIIVIIIIMAISVFIPTSSMTTQGYYGMNVHQSVYVRIVHR